MKSFAAEFVRVAGYRLLATWLIIATGVYAYRVGVEIGLQLHLMGVDLAP
jgi:hypothetical protein